MKKTILILIILIVVVGAGLTFYFLNQNKNSNSKETVNLPKLEEMTNTPESTTDLYVGDDFTIIRPKDWIQTQIQSTLVSFQNPNEKYQEGSAASKINFKSYIAVSFDNTQGKTFEEIAKLVKQQIQAVVPSVSFGSETDEMIDGQPAKIIEADLSQQDVDFKVLMAVIMKDDKYFTVSANTTAQKWTEYNEIFYDTFRSFKFKK